jgi:hypothetical protein
MTSVTMIEAIARVTLSRGKQYSVNVFRIADKKDIKHFLIDRFQ